SLAYRRRGARIGLELYAHPSSSFSQKVLIALYETATPLEWRVLEGGEGVSREFAARSPAGNMPLLVDGGRVLAEATIIIEHLGLHHPGPVRLIPADPAQALDVRFMDRFFDNYVMDPMQ